MSSAANPNPWPPYDSYKDCSQGICNLYCPQWCYIIFPPPPPSFYLGGDDDGDGGGSSSSDFSPLLIALIGILASAFILVSYYTVISKFCNRRRNAPGGASGRDRDISFSTTDTWQGNGTPATANGLDEALIKSIAVYKYRKGDGFVECTDCSVCLSEFEENERLRLLPKCNHAFHVHCIDTWLKSHSNCPLCRAYITTATTPSVNATDAAVAVSNNPISVHPIARESGNRGGGSTQINLSAVIHQRQTDDSVVVIEDLEIGARDEAVVNVNVGSQPKPPEQEASDVVRASRGGGGEETQAIRRSVSMNSGAAVVSVADILREIEDDENNDEDSVGAGTSQRREEEAIGKTASAAANQRNGVSNFLVRSSMAMRRSVSTGICILPRYDWGRNYRLPN